MRSIVGAGFSGLCAGIQLRQAGIEDFVILEKARRRRRHLARQHVSRRRLRRALAPLLVLVRAEPELDARVRRRPRSSRTSSTARRSTACARTSGSAHACRQARVRRGDRDVARVHADDERDVVARVAGPRQRRAAPARRSRTSGPRELRGRVFHSARWDHDYDLAGKRVAVIGTGASAIQFVPEIAPQVAAARRSSSARRRGSCRSPTARSSSARALDASSTCPARSWLRRAGLYWLLESRVLGFAFAPNLNALLEKLVLAAPRAIRCPTRELRAKLTPDYRIGCKRILISNDYYPALHAAQRRAGHRRHRRDRASAASARATAASARSTRSSSAPASASSTTCRRCRSSGAAARRSTTRGATSVADLPRHHRRRASRTCSS